MNITPKELKEICDLTVKLVEIRQRGCQHLSVENIAPELLHKLLTRYTMFKSGALCTSETDEHFTNAAARGLL